MRREGEGGGMDPTSRREHSLIAVVARRGRAGAGAAVVARIPAAALDGLGGCILEF